MPPLPDVPDTVRIRLLFDLGDKTDQGLRLFFGYEGGPPTISELVAIAEQINTQVHADLVPVTATTTTYVGTIIEDLASYDGAVGEATVSNAGTLEGDPLPASACFVMSHEIAVRYRGGHPRSYWPLGNTTYLTTPQEFTTAGVSGMGGAVSTLLGSITGMSSGGFSLTGQLAVSYYKGFTAVENPLTGRYRNVPTVRETPVVYVVQSLTARSYVGSQRRRRDKTSAS